MVVRSPTYIFPVAYACDPATHGKYEELGVAADNDTMALPTIIDAHLVRNNMAYLASQEPDRYDALAKSGFPVMDSRAPECVLLNNLFEKGGGII
ncbi:flavin-containing monooxygenase protein [Colletotrichum tofieldiae]|nr:flavin-containing monooxygenase protein [Colletotrichum tofieldiae]